MNTSINIIETKNLSYSYNDETPALDHVSVTIPKGKTTAILGGNGAGKSTLFLNLNGVLTPGEGEVVFDGKAVKYDKKGILEMRKRVGIVFQDPNDQLFSSSVRKDISFGAINLGLETEEVRARVERAVAQTGIAEYIDKPTHALSYGQKKRVAIAGVLVMNPDVIILDEPTAGLDSKGASEILQLLTKIKEETGVTVILATHEMDIVPIYCDYAYIMDHGKIILEGNIKEVLSKPDILRKHSLRLPRMAHLMEILNDFDNLEVDKTAATIAEARSSIMKVVKEGKELKCGYTTGSCATAAAKAGAIMLLSGSLADEVAVDTPKGLRLALQVEDIVRQDGWVSCSVIKDAGDDPDVTHGIKISARVEKTESGIVIDGGSGVGRVTRAGLSCAVGEAAINPVPRRMIRSALEQIAHKYSYQGGFSVVISAENGEEIAKKTFNPRLGITDGISILGTSGIVEPMSEKALIDTIHVEINSRVAENSEYLLVSPGNYGRDFALEKFGLDIDNGIKCSNFIGETIDYAVYKNVKNILLVGHAGKLCKIAGGIMNTHSRTADCRCEIYAAHAALAGASPECVKQIMEAVTTEEVNGMLRQAGIEAAVYESILKKIEYHLNYRAASRCRIEVILFTDQNSQSGDRAFYQTAGAEAVIKEFRRYDTEKREANS